MAIHVLEKILELPNVVGFEESRTINLVAPQNGVMYLRSTVAGNVIKVAVYQSQAVTGGQAAWNLRQNDTQLFSGASRPIVTVGNTSSTKTGLSIPTVIGDVFKLDIEEVPSGGVTAPVVLLIFVDDGVNSVVSIVAGDNVTVDDTDPANPIVNSTSSVVNLDDLGDVNLTGAADNDILTRVGGVWTPQAPAAVSSIGIYSPDKPYSSPDAKDDEFNAGSLDVKWSIENVTPTTNFNLANHIGFAGATANISGILQATTNVDQTFRMKVRPPQDVSVANLTMGFLLKRSGGYTELGYLTGAQKCYTWTWTSTTVNSAFVDLGLMFASPRHVQPFYLECRYVASGTTYQLFYSLDGVHFFSLASPVSLGGALTHIGITMRGGSGIVGYYDWFRKLQGTMTGGNL